MGVSKMSSNTPAAPTQSYNVDGSLPKATNWTPRAPSALIKSARWGLLLAGIVYGYRRRASLVAKETDPEYRAEQQFLHDVRRTKLVMKKKKAFYDELNEIAPLFEVQQLPPWQDKMYYEEIDDLLKQPRFPLKSQKLLKNRQYLCDYD